jgi:Gpi18-like mannosyltransferase
MPDNIFFDVWARWDSGFYLKIVESGYAYTPGQQSNVAFFPLYPLLVEGMNMVVGNPLISGIIVSHVCLLGALIFLYRLTYLEFGDDRTAQRAVYYIATFPTALFFSAVYTESTFLLFSVATAYFARRRLWVWASLFGLLTSASRIVGVLMLVIIGLEWLRAHGWTLKTIHQPEAWRNLWRAVRTDWVSPVFMTLVPLGLFSHMLFLFLNFQDPIIFWTAQTAWGRGNRGGLINVLWRDISTLMQQNFKTGEIFWIIALNLMAFLLVIIISIAVWRRLGEGYALYTLLGVLVPAWSGTGSMTRYALVMFPIFMMLAWWGRKATIDRAITTSFTIFLGIFIAIFVNWIFLA